MTTYFLSKYHVMRKQLANHNITISDIVQNANIKLAPAQRLFIES